ncbi:MAG: hypothetical protein IJP46_11050 [Prevotella sp.]|nr:hypothetical protein [Prevotella sp.]
MMKKIIWMLLALLVAVTGFESCSKSDDVTADGTTADGGGTSRAADLMDVVWVSRTESALIYLAFQSDGSVMQTGFWLEDGRVVGQLDFVALRYSISGNRISLTAVHDGRDAGTLTYAIVDGKLFLTNENGVVEVYSVRA